MKYKQNEDNPIKKCKYFHSDPYLTPNNYNLRFNYNNIPRNIPIEPSQELLKRLQQQLPLSKLLHLELESEKISHDNTVNIYTNTKLKFTVETNGRKETKEVNLK